MEVVIDWSSSCGDYSDNRKRMQQMVSRANVPRTMMSATRLTEPEKKELDWESRLEQRTLESQQFEARWEKWRLEFRQLLRNIISESGGEVAEGKELSCVQEEDQQVDSVEFQNSSDFDGREPSEVANDGVEHLISVRHEEIDMELEFGKLESHEKGEPIGELLLSCNSTDHDPLEVALTPWQITEELELSMPLPHNWNSAKVKGIDLELEQYVAEFSEYKTFSQANKLKEAECLPSARQIGTVRELAVTVRNLTRLPVRIPKPMVKMKLMAQHDDDELFESNYGCKSYFPFSGFPIKPTNGSSSSLFHGGVRSLYEIESHLEELKHFWPDFELDDENKMFGDFKLWRYSSKMYVKGEEEFPNVVQFCEVYASAGVLMSFGKYKVYDVPKEGFLGHRGFNILGGRGCLRTKGENGSAIVGMQHDQRKVCLFSLPATYSFLALIKDLNEYREYNVDIALPQHGCSVLQCCSSHSTGEIQEKLAAAVMSQEISANGLLLAQDAFENYVVQSRLELKIPSATSKVTHQFVGSYVNLSRQKFSSPVTKKCFVVCDNETWPRIIHEGLPALYCKQLFLDLHVNYVVQTALQVTEGKHGIGRVHTGRKAIAFLFTEFVMVTLASKVKAPPLCDIGWLVLIWFPKPTVKMKHERLGSGIPCGQGILRGMDCYDHKLMCHVS